MGQQMADQWGGWRADDKSRIWPAPMTRRKGVNDGQI